MGRGKKTTNCTNISNMMGATSGADTANPSWVHPPPVFNEVPIAQSLVFCVMFCRSLFVLYLLAIALSVLLIFTALD